MADQLPYDGVSFNDIEMKNYAERGRLPDAWEYQKQDPRYFDETCMPGIMEEHEQQRRQGSKG